MRDSAIYTLPSATEYIEIAAVTIPVAVTRHGAKFVVLHMDTGNFGLGATLQAAVYDCRRALIRDRDWYGRGAGRTLILEGVFARRRQAIWTLFGDSREGR